MPSSDNDLLLALFVNLRNAAATFGTDSQQYQTIHDMVYGHLRQMQLSGQKTDLTGTRQAQKDTSDLAAAFEKLDIELKNQPSTDSMEE